MKSKETVRAGFAQTKPVLGDTDRNCRAILKTAGRGGYELLVFPELATSGYDMSRSQVKSCAMSACSPFFTELADICISQNCAVVLGFPEKSGAKIYNSSIMINEKGHTFLYRKSHLFYREKELFEKGNTGFITGTASGAVIGQMICFDWFFPESARTLALKKADIIAHPANLVMPYCQDAMRIRTLENNVFAVTANRIGTENNYTFTGNSRIISNKGSVMARGLKSGTCVRFADIDYKVARNKHINPENDLFRDRRTDLYEI